MYMVHSGSMKRSAEDSANASASKKAKTADSAPSEEGANSSSSRPQSPKGRSIVIRNLTSPHIVLMTCL